MMIELLFSNPLLFIILAGALLLSLSLHEFAHAFAAYKLGDTTAKMSGRLTLNPLAHLDPVGTLLLLFAGFGWAKPVPVNYFNLREPKRDMALVSVAGPASNFVLALVSALVLNFSGLDGGLLYTFFYFFAFYNVGLGLFNLLPFHPLDGFKVVSGILPRRLAMQWEQLAPYGIFILFFMIFTNSFQRFLIPLMFAILRFLGIRS
jgi:Zn-dependent protease